MTSQLPRLSGDGRVYDSADFMATVHYEIRDYPIYRKIDTMDGSSLMPNGLRRELNLSDFSAPIPLNGSRLTLLMEDGRKINFFKQSDDEFVPTGDFYE